MHNEAAPLWGLIPAAGKGSRAVPYTETKHKALLDINGAPNIERIIAIMRDQLHIVDIVVVIGHLGEQIRQYLSDGSRLGVRLHYVDNHELDKGWAWSVLLARQYISSYFCMMLCDESYLSSNHAALLNYPWQDYLFTCAGLKVDDAALIKKNYAIEQQEGKLVRLIEKPVVIDNDIMGSGTFICSPDIFGYIEAAYSEGKNTIDFVSVLNNLLQQGKAGGFFPLSGSYVNINDRDSLALARYHNRHLSFASSKKALLVYAEGNEEGISFTLARYQEVGVFDEVIVVLPENNSILARVQDAGASAVICPVGCTLYGEKLLYAMQSCRADLVVFTEADYSFSSRDVAKLFTYLCDADMVIGTRTTRQLIEQGSTMRGLVRVAHTTLGKVLELLWWNREARFTDTGCTLRAFWRSTWEIIEQDLTTKGPEFSAEMMIACLDARLRVIEIPVNYFNRSASQILAYRNSRAFWSFLWLMIKKRLKRRDTAC